VFKVVLLLLGALVAACRNRADLGREILALRQQLAAFALSGRRPRATIADRWLWIALRRRWARSSDVRIFVCRNRLLARDTNAIYVPPTAAPASGVGEDHALRRNGVSTSE
jgi:hypothetical protein